MFRTYEQQAAASINDIISTMGFRPRPFEMRAIPFSGSWGTSWLLAFVLANATTERDQRACLAALIRKTEILWDLLDCVESATRGVNGDGAMTS